MPAYVVISAKCPSGKITYRTARKAIVALDQMRARRDRGLCRSEDDIYRCRHCRHCHLWHLTSKAGLIHERQDAA